MINKLMDMIDNAPWPVLLVGGSVSYCLIGWGLILFIGWWKSQW